MNFKTMFYYEASIKNGDILIFLAADDMLIKTHFAS